ncbi:MAG: hypothetical protein D4R43_02380 [Sphingobacteriales bacterium]|nr:MAG: hypothetical protein D4R43_02380 [Sphingobacteriales bacterium]
MCFLWKILECAKLEYLFCIYTTVFSFRKENIIAIIYNFNYTNGINIGFVNGIEWESNGNLKEYFSL